jgi:hypothetical protein
MQTGLAGIVGLTFKGIYEEIQKKRGRDRGQSHTSDAHNAGI